MSRRAPCPASLRIIRHSRTLRRVSITMNRCLGSATSLASLSWGDRGFTRAAKRTRGPNTQAKNQNKHSLKQAYSGPRSGDHEHVPASAAEPYSAFAPALFTLRWCSGISVFSERLSHRMRPKKMLLE